MKLTPDEIKGLRDELRFAQLLPDDRRIAECLLSAAERVAELEGLLGSVISGCWLDGEGGTTDDGSSPLFDEIEAALAKGAEHA